MDGDVLSFGVGDGSFWRRWRDSRNDGVSEMISQVDHGGSTQNLYERKDG